MTELLVGVVATFNMDTKKTVVIGSKLIKRNQFERKYAANVGKGKKESLCAIKEKGDATG